MIKSMSGYGRQKSLVGGKNITFEIKSVNNRFADISVRMPRQYLPLEGNVKELCAKYVTRGKIDLYLTVENIDGDPVSLTLNKEFVEGYLKLLEQIKTEYSVPGEITLSMLSGKSDIMTVTRADEDAEQMWKEIEPICRGAFEQYNSMRESEGGRLKEKLLTYLENVEALRNEVASLAPVALKKNLEKMRARINDLLAGVPVNEDRLLTECAAFTDKTDVTEELVRLQSHCTEFRATLDSDGPVGKKLEYIVPEMLRETNTLGSKCNDYEISRRVVAIKTEIEKLREQVANLE